MSEQINKLLCTTPQSFTTAEQKIGRDNISAQAKITFTYSGSTITGIDGSPVGGGLGEVYAGNCISGSGTSGSPLGLSSSVSLYKGNPYYDETYLSAGNVIVSGKYDGHASMTVYKDQSSHTIIAPTGIYNIHTAEGIGGGYTRSIYGEVFDLQYNGGSYGIKYISADDSGIHCESDGNTSKISKYGFGSAKFTDDTGTTWEVVDADSIRRWNSYTQITDGGDSANPVYISGGSALPVATARYVSTRIEGALANSWTASAVDMIVPLGSMQGQPAGTEPFYVKYAGKLITPYGVKLTLCCSGETLSTPTSVVSAYLDNAYVPAGSGYFNLNGITLGLGNNCNTKRTWVSAHFEENPMNSPITIDDNIGWFMNICTNPVGLVPRT